MPENKKHHYVPRFYLKRFSPDGRSISIWNIKNALKIPSANLRHQCYKKYLYGNELTVEKTLGIVEGETAHILSLIDKFQSPPPRRSNEYLMLVLYMLTQHGRTLYSSDTLDEMNDKMMKHLLGPEAKAKGLDIEKVTIGIKDSAKYSLGMVTQFYPLVLDLDCKLLLNETNVEFVTSDNPVVLYNQLFSFRKTGSNTGFASKGLQVFLPISSSMLLFFYDFNSYSVGVRSKTLVKVSSPRDVYELNTLQMTSAYENVYFENPHLNIEALYRRALPFRRTQKASFGIFPGEKTEDTRSELMAISREDIRTNLKLSFARIRKGTKAWSKKFQEQKMQPAVVVRNQQLCDDYEEFFKKINDGEFNPGDFFKFIAQKYDKN